MSPAVDAVLVVAVAAIVGLATVGLRPWRPRRRRPVSLAPAPAGSDGSEPPWAVVVANPTKIADIEGEIDWLEERSVELGWARPVWLETTLDDPGLGQGRVALRAGAHTVLAYGGDGTVRAVATALIGSGVPLGLLPAGTGNLLARNLDVPFADLDAALTVALTGIDRAIDVGRVQVDVSGEDQQPRAETFLVMAGVGVCGAGLGRPGRR